LLEKPGKQTSWESYSNLFAVAFKGGKYWFSNIWDFEEADSIKNPQDQIWFVMKHMSNWIFPGWIDSKKGYLMDTKDIVKFGWVRFKVN